MRWCLVVSNRIFLFYCKNNFKHVIVEILLNQKHSGCWNFKFGDLEASLGGGFRQIYRNEIKMWLIFRKESIPIWNLTSRASVISLQHIEMPPEEIQLSQQISRGGNSIK